MLIVYIVSQILGYTGTVSNSELEDAWRRYESNDVVVVNQELKRAWRMSYPE